MSGDIVEAAFGEGKAAGKQLVADALATECADAVKSGDCERAKRFALARDCVRQLFPDLK